MKKNYGLIAAVVIILFSVYVYVNTLTITSTANAALGPAFMPKLVAVILFILGWLDLLEEIRKKKDETIEEGKSMERSILISRVDVFSAILLLCYVFSIKRLGFFIASTIYMLLQMLLLTVNTKRNYVLMMILAVLVPGLIYFGFVKIFYLMLPPGILG